MINFGQFQKSLRVKLLAPLAGMLAATFILLAIVMSAVQGRLLDQMGEEIGNALLQSGQTTQQDLQNMSQKALQSIEQMAESTGKVLEYHTRQALEAEKRQIKAESERTLRENAEAMATLLALVAPKAILSNSFLDLVNYVKSANENPDVVYVIYIRPDGKPYTTFFNRNHSKIQNYLSSEQGDRIFEKIIHASKKDPSVLLVEKTIAAEGKPLGSVMICISKATMETRISIMGLRFTGLIDASGQTIRSTIQAEADKVIAGIAGAVQTMGTKNKEFCRDLQANVLKAQETVGSLTRKIILAAGAVCGLILMVCVGLLAVFLLIRPIDQVARRLEDIAQGEGDLTRRLEVKTQDEVGRLAHWFNVFVEKLQAVIGDVAHHAGTVASSSEALSTVSQQMSNGAALMASQSSDVSAAAEQMNLSMVSVASASEQVAANMNAVASSVDNMSATIAEIAQHTEKAKCTSETAVDRVKNTSNKVDILGQSAQAIGKVTEVIAEISDQTNLLALNATIEAARAGEAGKGFAVVANEIKELARQTASATHDIKAKIDGIQNSTDETVSEIEQIVQVIAEVNATVSTIAAAVEEQSSATRQIASHVSEATSSIQQVNENIGLSTTAAGEIAKEIGQVNQEAENMSRSSHHINDSAGELSQLAVTLTNRIGGFKFANKT
jgi:methyl-accepting chemotaxis protein